MKRYLLFAYSAFHPNGGWNDFKEDFDTIDEASMAVSQYVHKAHVDIVDSWAKYICESHYHPENYY